MSKVLDVVLTILKKEAENVIEFLTTPKGIFETLDKMVVDARTELQKLIPRVMR